MDFWTAVRRTAEGLSSDLSMDPTMQDAKDPRDRGMNVAPTPSTDGGDPATPGGPGPYNGAPPFGEPVTSDPEWLDPQTQIEQPDRRPVPHIEGPNQMQNTLRSNAATAARGEDVSSDLWIEASADVEADAAALRMSRAKVAVASLWPFLAMARSTREFEHRLALTADRIGEKVETDLYERVLASLREDFLVVANEDPDARPTERGDLIGHELEEHPLGGQQHMPWGGYQKEHEEEAAEPAARRAISPVKDEHYDGGPWTEDYKPDAHSYQLRSLNSRDSDDEGDEDEAPKKWDAKAYGEAADRKQRQEAGPWNNYGVGHSKSSGLEFFDASLGRWVAAEDDGTAGKGNPDYFVGGPEAGPATGMTNQFAPHPTGSDPWSPINQEYPAQPQPWTVTPGTEWRENPMQFNPPGGGNHPYQARRRTAAEIGDQDTCKACGKPVKYVKNADGDRFWSHVGPDGWQHDDSHLPQPDRYSKQGSAEPFAAQTSNPAYFAGGPEGVTGPDGAQFPVEPDEDPTSEAVNFYGQVPPQMSSGSGRTATVERKGPDSDKLQGTEFASEQERARYAASQDEDADPGDRASFWARKHAFFDPFDPGVRMVTAAGENTPQTSAPPESAGGAGGVAGGAPQPPPAMMGGPGSNAMPVTTPPRQIPSGGGGGGGEMPPGADMDPMATAARLVRMAASGESYERPDDDDPTGAGDEYDHNTWEGPLQTRPRQAPEQRGVNTPQRSRQPIPTVSSPSPMGDEAEERREARRLAARIARELVGV